MTDTVTFTGTLLASIETEYWDADTLARYNIAEAISLYVIPHDGESTADVTAIPVENVFHFWPGTPEHVQEVAREELLYEATGEPNYLMRTVIEGDPRFRVLIEAEADAGEEIHRMTDLLLEAVHSGAADEPAICSFEAWEEYDRERTAKRRARNLPPIANWGANGLDNLPLFVAAAQPILSARLARAERLAERVGACAAGKWQRKPVEALNWSWPL